MGKTAAGLSRALLLCGAAFGLFLIGPAGAGADAGSLYQGPGPRPGPDILYEPLGQRAPQLTNAGIWKAPPILVSGASAYRDGEFLYQDFLYDDHGARRAARTRTTRASPATRSPSPTGTYTYPTDARLREQRGRLRRAARQAARDRDRVPGHAQHAQGPRRLVAFTIAIGGSPGVPRPFPLGANVSAPADLFLTVHGPTADLLGRRHRAAGRRRAADRDRRHDPPPDRGARAALQLGPDRPGRPPRGRRRASGTAAADSYLLPAPTADATAARRRRRGPPARRPSSTSPSASTSRCRTSAEPPTPQRPGLVARQGAGRRARDRRHQPVPRRTSTSASSPRARRRHAAARRRAADRPDGPHPREPLRDRAGRRLLGQLLRRRPPAPCPGVYHGQPAALRDLRARSKPMPADGYGMTLLLHSLAANYNQYLGSRNQSQFGERGSGSIVITPAARGPDGWYYDYAGADMFEVWADVAAPLQARPGLDRDHRLLDGRHRHLQVRRRSSPTCSRRRSRRWARPASASGCRRRPQPGGAQLEHQPHARVAAQHPVADVERGADELVPVAGTRRRRDRLDDARLPLRVRPLHRPSTSRSRSTTSTRRPPSSSAPTKVDRNPAARHLRLQPDDGLPRRSDAAGHAYWVSDVTLRNASGTAPLGTIDVRSRGFGVGDPTPSGTAPAPVR